MQIKTYQELAKVYDLLYSRKDYLSEVDFLSTILQKYKVRSLLDAGCGTGTHMALLEDRGFACTGADLNGQMLAIARNKVKGKLIQADIADFSFGQKYDAVICMFAVFNHLLDASDAEKVARNFRQHLFPTGIAVIDLHNPQKGGKKVDCIAGIERTMEWQYNSDTGIESTIIHYKTDGTTIEESLFLRIYSADEVIHYLRNAGFINFQVLEGYKMDPAKPTSKNLEIIATLQ
jgi:SAM-dependent methyltransferase